MNMNEKTAELEALLFIHGEPLTLKKIGAILEVKPDELGNLIAELKNRLADDTRGLTLIEDGEKLQFATKPQFGRLLEKFIKEELSEDLSPASLETLSLVAYFGPISRTRLDYVRGVNSSFILRSLLLRGLVERFPDPDRANAFLYRPTFDLLRHLGLEKKENLPDFEKFQTLLKTFESQVEMASEAAPAETGAVESTLKEEEN